MKFTFKERMFCFPSPKIIKICNQNFISISLFLFSVLSTCVQLPFYHLLFQFNASFNGLDGGFFAWVP